MAEWMCARGRERFTDEELEKTEWKCLNHPRSYIFEIKPVRPLRIGSLGLRPMPYQLIARRYIIQGRILR